MSTQHFFESLKNLHPAIEQYVEDTLSGLDGRTAYLYRDALDILIMSPGGLTLRQLAEHLMSMHDLKGDDLSAMIRNFITTFHEHAIRFDGNMISVIDDLDAIGAPEDAADSDGGDALRRRQARGGEPLRPEPKAAKGTTDYMSKYFNPLLRGQ